MILIGADLIPSHGDVLGLTVFQLNRRVRLLFVFNLLDPYFDDDLRYTADVRTQHRVLWETSEKVQERSEF